MLALFLPVSVSAVTNLCVTTSTDPETCPGKEQVSFEDINLRLSQLSPSDDASLEIHDSPNQELTIYAKSIMSNVVTFYSDGITAQSIKIAFPNLNPTGLQDKKLYYSNVNCEIIIDDSTPTPDPSQETSDYESETTVETTTEESETTTEVSETTTEESETTTEESETTTEESETTTEESETTTEESETTTEESETTTEESETTTEESETTNEESEITTEESETTTEESETTPVEPDDLENQAKLLDEKEVSLTIGLLSLDRSKLIMPVGYELELTLTTLVVATIEDYRNILNHLDDVHELQMPSAAKKISIGKESITLDELSMDVDDIDNIFLTMSQAEVNVVQTKELEDSQLILYFPNEATVTFGSTISSRVTIKHDTKITLKSHNGVDPVPTVTVDPANDDVTYVPERGSSDILCFSASATQKCADASLPVNVYTNNEDITPLILAAGYSTMRLIFAKNNDVRPVIDFKQFSNKDFTLVGHSMESYSGDLVKIKAKFAPSMLTNSKISIHNLKIKPLDDKDEEAVFDELTLAGCEIELEKLTANRLTSDLQSLYEVDKAVTYNANINDPSGHIKEIEVSSKHVEIEGKDDFKIVYPGSALLADTLDATVAITSASKYIELKGDGKDIALHQALNLNMDATDATLYIAKSFEAVSRPEFVTLTHTSAITINTPLKEIPGITIPHSETGVQTNTNVKEGGKGGNSTTIAIVVVVIVVVIIAVIAIVVVVRKRGAQPRYGDSQYSMNLQDDDSDPFIEQSLQSV